MADGPLDVYRQVAAEHRDAMSHARLCVARGVAGQHMRALVAIDEAMRDFAEHPHDPVAAVIDQQHEAEMQATSLAADNARLVAALADIEGIVRSHSTTPLGDAVLERLRELWPLATGEEA
jgi:hypothetical protein